MNLLKSLARETIGLFIEDEFLAIATLAVVGVTAFVIKTMATDPVIAGFILLGGCVVVLVAGVWHTARAHARSNTVAAAG
jgi:uncharacterized membrane-anchored protein